MLRGRRHAVSGSERLCLDDLVILDERLKIVGRQARGAQREEQHTHGAWLHGIPLFNIFTDGASRNRWLPGQYNDFLKSELLLFGLKGLFQNLSWIRAATQLTCIRVDPRFNYLLSRVSR